MDNKEKLILEKYMKENPIQIVFIELQKPKPIELKFKNLDTSIDPEILKKLEKLKNNMF